MIFFSKAPFGVFFIWKNKNFNGLSKIFRFILGLIATIDVLGI